MKHVVDGKLYTMEDAPVTTLEERIQRLEDIEAIKSIMYNYTRCTDNLDADGIAAMFTETGTFCSPALGNPTGRKAIAELYSKLLPGTKSSTHLIANQQIWFKTNDNAVMHCYLHAWQTFEDYPKKPDCFTYGRYEVEVVREDDGEWRVQNFKIVMAGQLGGGKCCDHFARPWPPAPDQES